MQKKKMFFKNSEHERDGDTNCKWWAQNNSQKIGKETRRLGNKRTRRHHPDYNIIKIG